MNTDHRYFNLVHSSDALLASYRQELAQLTAAEDAFWTRLKRGALAGVALSALCIFGCGALEASSPITSKGLGSLAVLLAAIFLFIALAGVTRFDKWRQRIPVEGRAELLTPLEAGSAGLLEMETSCATYPDCRAYLDAVRRMPRKLYLFDANYVAELAAVIKRGDSPLKSDWPVDAEIGSYAVEAQ